MLTLLAWNFQGRVQCKTTNIESSSACRGSQKNRGIERTLSILLASLYTHLIR